MFKFDKLKPVALALFSQTSSKCRRISHLYNESAIKLNRKRYELWSSNELSLLAKQGKALADKKDHFNRLV